MQAGDSLSPWRVRNLAPRFPWSAHTLRPAEVGEALVLLMLDRTSQLEDARYQKLVPNRYRVELNPDDYARHFSAILVRLIQQWKEKLMIQLVTANSRLGRKEYAFGGRIQIEIVSTPLAGPGCARLLACIQAEESIPAPLPVALAGVPCPSPAAATLAVPLELSGATSWLVLGADEARWPLPAQGIVILGRRAGCQVQIDLPEVQACRLVSGQHAYIQAGPHGFRLFDGDPQGRPSVNGTFVNGRPVPPAGVLLQDGDQILLAALDPAHPRADTPGVALLRFVLARSLAARPQP